MGADVYTIEEVIWNVLCSATEDVGEKERQNRKLTEDSAVNQKTVVGNMMAMMSYPYGSMQSAASFTIIEPVMSIAKAVSVNTGVGGKRIILDIC